MIDSGCVVVKNDSDDFFGGLTTETKRGTGRRPQEGVSPIYQRNFYTV